MASKKKKIKRNLTFAQRANTEAQDWFNDSQRGVGSYFNKGSRKAGSGLSYEEERILMPELINAEVLDRDFRQKVEDFFTDITTKVPYNGLELEVGLIDEATPIGKIIEESSDSTVIGMLNMPLNIEEYVRYRHAISHPRVAQSEQHAGGNQLIDFYVEDDVETLQQKIDFSKLYDDASALYLSIKDKEDKVDRILVNLGVDTRGFSEGEKVLKLRNKLEDYKKEDETTGTKKLKYFISVINNKNLETEAKINKLIHARLLERIGNRIVITESKDQIGASMTEAILWFEDAENSDVVNTLRAKYQEFGRIIKR